VSVNALFFFFVANLCPEKTTMTRIEPQEIGRNVKSSKSLVAATFEKANSYVFAEKMIHNPKVDSSFFHTNTLFNHYTAISRANGFSFDPDLT
jgi:hypothetical protein